MNPSQEEVNRILTFLASVPQGRQSGRLTDEELAKYLREGGDLRPILAAKGVVDPQKLNAGDYAAMGTPVAAGLGGAAAASAGMGSAGALGASTVTGAMALPALAGFAVNTWGKKDTKGIRPFNPEDFRNQSYIIDQQIPGFSKLRPEVQDRILNAAWLQGYIKSKGSNDTTPTKIGEGEVHLGDWNKEKPGWTQLDVPGLGPNYLKAAMSGKGPGALGPNPYGNLMNKEFGPEFRGDRGNIGAFQEGVRQLLNDPSNFQMNEDMAKQKPTAQQVLSEMSRLPGTEGLPSSGGREIPKLPPNKGGGPNLDPGLVNPILPLPDSQGGRPIPKLPIDPKAPYNPDPGFNGGGMITPEMLEEWKQQAVPYPGGWLEVPIGAPPRSNTLSPGIGLDGKPIQRPASGGLYDIFRQMSNKRK